MTIKRCMGGVSFLTKGRIEVGHRARLLPCLSCEVDVQVAGCDLRHATLGLCADIGSTRSVAHVLGDECGDLLRRTLTGGPLETLLGDQDGLESLGGHVVHDLVDTDCTGSADSRSDSPGDDVIEALLLLV